MVTFERSDRINERAKQLMQFVIDSSLPSQTAESTVELLQLIGHADLAGKPLLLVVNKWYVGWSMIPIAKSPEQKEMLQYC